MNVALPRQPRMPWTKAWAPLFDAGVKWVRIGQYESPSDQVSWDWVEQTPGHYAVPEGAEEAIRSLRENGVSIETQLQYSNPLYAEDKSKRPDRVAPAGPGVGVGPEDDPVNGTQSSLPRRRMSKLMRFSAMFASWSAATKDKSTIGNSGMKRTGSTGSRTLRRKEKGEMVWARFLPVRGHCAYNQSRGQSDVWGSSGSYRQARQHSCRVRPRCLGGLPGKDRYHGVP